MTSLKQWAANRENAQKSTGPRTEEGKRRYSAGEWALSVPPLRSNNSLFEYCELTLEN
jgi:hypothetical protein